MARKPAAGGSNPAKTLAKATPPLEPKAKPPRVKAAAPKSEPSPPPEPATPPPAEAESPRAAQKAEGPKTRLDASQRQAIETLSLNLARASLTAQGAITDAMLRQGKGAPSADPFHVAPALTEVMGKLVLKPERIMRAQAELFESYMDLWTQSARRATGEASAPVAAPAKGDKRFNDPDWSANPMFDMMKQSYLLTSNWLNGLVAEVEDVDPLTKRRVEFFTKMLTDAFSPSNFLISNPAGFPPWINKYSSLDLRPENSMIRWLTGQGFTVFVTSWVNPDGALAHMTLADYMFGGAYEALEQVLKQTGAKTANTVGYCIGGTLLSCTLAHMAEKGDQRISSATFFAAQQDFTEAGDLLLFTGDAWLKDLEQKIDAEVRRLVGEGLDVARRILVSK